MFTQLRKNRSKKLFYKSILIYCSVLVGAILLLFGIKSLFNSFSPKLPIYNTSRPAETITVDAPFKSQVYFNNVLNQTTFLDGVVNLIDQSQKTLEIAMFSLDSSKVVDAIYRANTRGVQVTLVLDMSRSKKHSVVLASMPSGIKRVDVGSYNEQISTETTYMHHKFILIDRNTSNSKMLTGSMDFTEQGEKYQQSFYLVTPDQTLIKYYGKIFDLLKKGIYGSSKFDNESYNPWLVQIQYSDSYVSMWSSPGYQNQSVKYKILNLIQNAKSNIKIMMWQFTDKDIAKALVNRAKKGINVTIIEDDLFASDANSVIPFLQKTATDQKMNNLVVILDSKSKKLIDLSKLREDFNPFVHHHEMIVDDNTLLFGTMNWTEWGFTKNDEDTLITDNAYLIGEFEKTFQYFSDNFK